VKSLGLPEVKVLLTVPNTKVLAILAILLSAAFIGFSAYLFRLDKPLAPYSTIQFEFARTPERAGDMFKEWGAEHMAVARRGLLLDFAYMPVYALACAALTLLAARFAPDWLQNWGLWLLAAPFVAWGLDIIENFGLLAALNQWQAPPPLPLAVSAGAAAAKFGLLGLALLYIVGAPIARVVMAVIARMV
jgi:hypothetical protein